MTKQTPLQLLEQARSLLEDKDRWSRHFLSETSNGYGMLDPSDVKSHQATRFNAEGALIRCHNGKYFGTGIGVVGEAYEFLFQASVNLCCARSEEMARHHCSVTTLNKVLGYEAVLEAYDQAIIEAKVAEYRAKLEGDDQ